MRSPWSPCKCMYLSKEQFSMQLMLRAWHSGLELHGGHRCPFNHCRALLMTSNMHYVQKPFPITSWIGMIIELLFFFYQMYASFQLIFQHTKNTGEKKSLSSSKSLLGKLTWLAQICRLLRFVHIFLCWVDLNF